MTRPILLLTLLAGAAFGQTYVRPSKGATFLMFPSAPAGWGAFPNYSGSFDLYSAPYDWSAFEAARVRIYTDGVGNNAGGQPCSLQSAQYSVADFANFIKFRLNTGGSGFLSLYDSSVAGGTYTQVVGPNTKVNMSRFKNCNITIQVTPLPFTPSVLYGSLPDGGISYPTSITANVNFACTTTRSTNTSVGTTVTAVPADGGLTDRQWVRLCNSARNSGNPIITCATGGAVPDAGIDGIGEALEVSDCAVYSTPLLVQCISDTANTRVTAEECE